MDSLIKKDTVYHPAHYTMGDIECKEAIRAALGDALYVEGFCRGNAIKYLWRSPFKNGAEDLKKAKFYIDEMLSISQ